MKRILLFLLLMPLVCCPLDYVGQKTVFEYKRFISQLLEVWTELDLIRATEASDYQKVLVSNVLIELIVPIYCQLKHLLVPHLHLTHIHVTDREACSLVQHEHLLAEGSHLSMTVSQQQELLDLLADIIATFDEVFDGLDYAEAITISCLLHRIEQKIQQGAGQVHDLELPQHV